MSKPPSCQRWWHSPLPLPPLSQLSLSQHPPSQPSLSQPSLSQISSCIALGLNGTLEDQSDADLLSDRALGRGLVALYSKIVAAQYVAASSNLVAFVCYLTEEARRSVRQLVGLNKSERFDAFLTHGFSRRPAIQRAGSYTRRRLLPLAIPIPLEPNCLLASFCAPYS